MLIKKEIKRTGICCIHTTKLQSNQSDHFGKAERCKALNHDKQPNNFLEVLKEECLKEERKR